LTILESEYFYYNGHYSTEYKLLNVTVDYGLYKEKFMSKVIINRQKIRGRDKPYYMGKEREPIQFQVSFAFSETYDDVLIEDILKWLSPAYFEEMYFSEYPSLIFYCMPVDDIEIVHNGLKEGYLTLTFENIDCYKRSPVYSTLVDNSTDSVVEIMNLGSVSIYPKIEIEKLTEIGDISIFNLSNGNIEFKIEDLAIGEIVTIYNEDKDITTTLTNTYHYDDHNGYWLELLTGNNRLSITGKCNINFTYEFKYL